MGPWPRLNTMFKHDVNTVFQAALFGGQESDMHPSMPRLLHCAREATRGKRGAITDFKDIGVRLGESSGTITNWKSRGISKEGALKAARAFGCSATWLLDGKGDPGTGSAAPEPAPEVDELQAALALIAQAVATASEETRVSVGPLFSLLASKPDLAVNIAQQLHLLLTGGVSAVLQPENGRSAALVTVLTNTEKMRPSDGKRDQLHSTRAKK